MRCRALMQVARGMFDRQAASFDADPALTELAWADAAIRDFWLDEARAVVDCVETLARSEP